jgi:hypothetical protein
MRREGLPTRRPSVRQERWDSPVDFDGLLGWFRADHGITLNTTQVAAWAKIAGSGADLAQVGANQPTFIESETDFPVPQPAVKFDVSTSSLTGGPAAGVMWMAAVAVYPGTTFGNFNGLIIGSVSGVGQTPFRGDSGAATWRVSTGPAGARYRDGQLTNTALTTADTPHLYEFAPDAVWNPSGGIVRVGCDDATAGREWSDSVAELIFTSKVPSAVKIAKFRAYIRSRYGFSTG